MRAWARGGDAIMSASTVQGQGVSTSTESCRGGEVVVAGENSHGVASVGWASSICYLEAISCEWAWLVGCGDKVERGGGHGQWPRGLFALCWRVGSTEFNAASCSSSYMPKMARSACVCVVCE